MSGKRDALARIPGPWRQSECHVKSPVVGGCGLRLEADQAGRRNPYVSKITLAGGPDTFEIIVILD
jgi:hypothetical protein